MADVHSKGVRSKNMAAIKSAGNASTEEKLRMLFRANGIRGWRRQYRKLEERPDFVFVNRHLAIFVDGCFWHGCKRCGAKPKTNKEFWMNKIAVNSARDRRVNAVLRAAGWRTVRIWEHQLKRSPQRVVGRIVELLS